MGDKPPKWLSRFSTEPAAEGRFIIKVNQTFIMSLRCTQKAFFWMGKAYSIGVWSGVQVAMHPLELSLHPLRTSAILMEICYWSIYFDLSCVHFCFIQGADSILASSCETDSYVVWFEQFFLDLFSFEMQATLPHKWHCEVICQAAISKRCRGGNGGKGDCIRDKITDLT